MIRKKPLVSVSEDRLGLDDLAKHLGFTLKNIDAETGFIIGVSGRWGSGKTSLLNMAFEQVEILQKYPVAKININPWSIPPDEDLVQFFLSEFSRQLKEQAELIGSQMEGAVSELAGAAESLGRFARRLTPLAKLAKVAADFDVPLANLVAGSIDGVAAIGMDESFSKGKERIEGALSKLLAKVYVVIDDLDRVEPSRVAQILMTVRAIADFPNVTYILLYERASICHSIEQSLDVESGADFLEKVVQFEISLPEPESFTLRRLFRERLAQRMGELDIDIIPSEKLVLGQVIEHWGGRYLTNPRRVEQVVDNVAFLVTNKQARVFLPDAVFISILKVGSKNFYSWVEEYLIGFSSIAISGAMLARGERKKIAERFREICELEGWDTTYERIVIDDFLPGIQSSFSQDEPEKAFFNRHVEIPAAGKLRRIGSPDHYRLYFSGGFASDAPSDRFLSQVINSLETSSQFTTLLSELNSMAQTRSFEAALNRIWRGRIESLPDSAGPVAMGVFSDLADQMAVLGGFDDLFDEPTVWSESRYFLERVKPASIKVKDVRSLFLKGKAIGWLIALVRSETFAHGLYGSQSEQKSKWILSEEQLLAALSSINRRLKNMPFKEFLLIPRMNHALFAWVQGGFAEEAQDYIRRKTRSNRAFLDFVAGFDTGGSVTSRVIRPDGCRDIFEFRDFFKRMQKLAANPEFKEEAQPLLSKFQPNL